MTYRGRLEAKIERRAEWADKAKARSAQRFEAADKIAQSIPFGQPILVGHHSEGHARADQKRIHSNMDKGCAEAALAKHHEAKADGLERQLDRSIFSDDANAIAELEQRIAEREAECARMKAVNTAWRKSEKAAPELDKPARLAVLVKASVITDNEAMAIARFFGLCHWEQQPFPAYATTNQRSSIRRDRERIEEIKRRQAMSAKADTAPGGVLIENVGTTEAGQPYSKVTFAEKPDWEVLNALRAAGYAWSRGSWVGETAKLPEAVRELCSVVSGVSAMRWEGGTP